MSELFVDSPGNSDDKIPVQINITLPRLACECKFTLTFCFTKHINGPHISHFQMSVLTFKMISGGMKLGLLKTRTKRRGMEAKDAFLKAASISIACQVRLSIKGKEMLTSSRRCPSPLTHRQLPHFNPLGREATGQYRHGSLHNFAYIRCRTRDQEPAGQLQPVGPTRSKQFRCLRISRLHHEDCADHL